MLPLSRAVLVIAHPGHELRVHGWVETVRPSVWVLTDGSGRSQCSRIDSTTRIIAAAGANAGPIYGDLTDTQLYAAVLDLNHQQFIQIVDMLADDLVRDEVEYVVGDAAEGYNPAHDICRLIINAAVTIARCKSKRTIGNYEFSLVGADSGYHFETGAMSLNLDNESLNRKLYALGHYPELRAEVEAALNGGGSVGLQQHPELARRAGFQTRTEHNLRREILRPVNRNGGRSQNGNGTRPFYEEYGETRVAAGHYRRVLRYREHVMPLASALDRHVERKN